MQFVVNPREKPDRAIMQAISQRLWPGRLLLHVRVTAESIVHGTGDGCPVLRGEGHTRQGMKKAQGTPPWEWRCDGDEVQVDGLDMLGIVLCHGAGDHATPSLLPG